MTFIQHALLLMFECTSAITCTRTRTRECAMDSCALTLFHEFTYISVRTRTRDSCTHAIVHMNAECECNSAFCTHEFAHLWAGLPVWLQALISDHMVKISSQDESKDSSCGFSLETGIWLPIRVSIAEKLTPAFQSSFFAFISEVLLIPARVLTY